MHGGLLGLEFRMHEGVSSLGIPKGGGGAKNSDLPYILAYKSNACISRTLFLKPKIQLF